MFLIGMAVSLGLIWMAFEYRTNDLNNNSKFTSGIDQDLTEEIVPNTTPPPEAPKPKLETFNLQIADNSVSDLPEVNFSSEFEEEEEIEQYDLKREEQVLDDDEIFPPYLLQDEPEFPGGDQGLFDYIGNNVVYPEISKRIGSQGKVYIGFVVEKDGSVSNVQVLRGIDEDCDAEAVRVVREMPKWKPGRQLGKAVRVSYQLPIVFTLK
jgi:protein TonB